jgi:GT2 family glycosyltransferase
MILENNKNLGKSMPEILSQTLATIVLYNTSLGSSITFQSLGKALIQVGLRMDILIYDNSAVAQKIPHSANEWNIHYVHDASNGGVSKAYNSAFEMAKRSGKKWLLLLDQDTTYPVSVFSEYCHSITHHHNQQVFVPRLIDSLGMASPLKFKRGGGQRIKNLVPGIHSTYDLKFHNCGLFISTVAFEQAGGYDEQLPLDFSDFSFVDRLKKNHPTFVVTETTGEHHLAATSVTGVEERFIRFTSYLKSCRYYRATYQSNDAWISVRLFLRSVKLSLTHRSARFLVHYLTR